MGPELIREGDRIYCLIVPSGMMSTSTTFLTHDPDPLQLGFIVRKGGEPILRHVHLKAERVIDVTWEFLLVRKGTMRMTIYNDARERIAERRLSTGDAVLLMGGGHGFEPEGDVVLLEVKQGPYTATQDKERF